MEIKDFDKPDVLKIIKENCNYPTRILKENKKALLLPAISPLGLNHLMILPKNHEPNCSSLINNDYEYFNDCLFYALSKFEKQSDYETILFEHGVTSESTNGCGVNYAHIHLLPLKKKLIPELFGKLFLDHDFSSANGIRESYSNLNFTKEYLYIEVLNSNSLISIGNEFKSQFFRKFISGLQNDTYWDWNDYYNWDIFNKTISNFL